MALAWVQVLDLAVVAREAGMSTLLPLEPGTRSAEITATAFFCPLALRNFTWIWADFAVVLGLVTCRESEVSRVV